jgi:hypothetical protein
MDDPFLILDPSFERVPGKESVSRWMLAQYGFVGNIIS